MLAHRTPQVLSFLLHPCKPCSIKRLRTFLRNGNPLFHLVSVGSAFFLSQRGWGGYETSGISQQRLERASAAEVATVLRPPSSPGGSIRRNRGTGDVPQRLEDPAARGVVESLIVRHLEQIG